jgi:uncharacterized membrane protein YdjX (TVP38/TMEM64 family)
VADEKTIKESRKERKRLIKDLARVGAVAAVFIAIGIALKQPYVRDQLLNIDTIRQRFQGTGWRDEMAFVLAAAVVNAVGVPRLWVSVVAGTLYGAVWGTILAMVSTLIGTTIDFYVARYLLRGPIKRQLPKRLRRWYDLFNRNGLEGTLYIRFFPLANATVTNLIGGASKVKYGVFMLGTIIGFTPLTIIFATFGSSAAKHSALQGLVGIGLFAALVVGSFLWKRTHRMPPELEEEASRNAVEETAP